MEVIEVKNLTKEFKYYKTMPGFKGIVKNLFSRDYIIKKAVNDISFNIKQGELVGFIGPNGAGKTTTLKVLSGLLYPTGGSVKVLDYKPFDKKHSFLRSISILMGQKSQFTWDLSANDTFKLLKEIYDVPSNEYLKTLDELVYMLSASDIIDKQVRKLSLGERMKCELIGALLYRPKVLFLDEPTIGLDVVVSKKLRTFIKDYNQKYESTILLTSHYMHDVSELCKRVIIINNGILYYDGLLSELVRKYAAQKSLVLTFSKEISKESLSKYGHIESFDNIKATINIDREKIKESAAEILTTLPVEDIEINEIAIEDVIRNIFENK